MPARIHIRLAPLDRELPSLSEARARRELPARLAEWVEGEVELDGDQLWIDPDDGADGDQGETLAQVEQVLADLGLEEQATVEVEPGV